MGETIKAHERRVREHWFSRYAPEQLSGIDIGCGTNALNHTFRRWDQMYGDGDASLMAGVPDNLFNTVYASHVLEHLRDPVLALKNWYRILRPGGHLIVCVPHRDLYEKKKDLPSLWNHDHKTFWLPDRDEPPVTRSFRGTILQAIPGADFQSFRVLDDGWIDGGPLVHSLGEFSIEAIIRK